MVTVLRIVAVILFIFQSGFDISATIIQQYKLNSTYPAHDAMLNLYGTTMVVVNYIMRGLFQSAILLALAELIKIKKDTK